MCYDDFYGKEHVSMPDDSISGGGRLIPSTSSKEAILSLVRTINFIYNGLQCFEINYQNSIIIYKKIWLIYSKQPQTHFIPKKWLLQNKILYNYQGISWVMVYRQYEWKYTPYQD